jgi:hypothetical protein
MGVYKSLEPADVKSVRSQINQLVDIIQEDISGSSTRRKYEVFVTGGIGPGVTSSLYQTVYDQDFTLQTANPILDFTIGLYPSGAAVTGTQVGTDSAGKMLFPSTSLMMREKVSIYEQYAQLLLGSNTSYFVSPHGSTIIGNGLKEEGREHNQINEALFINVKRLFARDKIKRETFAMRFYQSASMTSRETHVGYPDLPNIETTSMSGSSIYSDVGSATNKQMTAGGGVGNIVDSSNTSRGVGLMFYDHGIAVLDLGKVLSGSQHVSGVIPAMSNVSYKAADPGQTVIGAHGNANAKFIPDFVTSASIDTVVNHITSCRFSSGSLTATTFQNVTEVNSTLFFCRASAGQFNYSSNPTYTDSSDKIVVIDEGEELNQRAFSFATSVGLYDTNNNLLAVAKLSRPVEKNDSKDVTFRIRLDF